MNDASGPTIPDDDDKSRLDRIVDQVVGTNSAVARPHVARSGGGESGKELLRRLDRQYRDS